jgi:hypothetical protein
MKLFFTLSLILIISIIHSQNCHNVKEIISNRHAIIGHTKGHPYTLFDRQIDITFQETINNIRKRIILEKDSADIFFAYKAIFTKAQENRPSDGGLYNLKTNGDPGAPSSL